MPYLVFSFGDYYPNGGLNDMVGTAATIREAKKKAFEHSGEYKQIFNTENSESQEFSEGEWKLRCS